LQGTDIRKTPNNQEKQIITDLEDVQMINANERESTSSTRNLESERTKMTGTEICSDPGEDSKPMDEDKPISELQHGEQETEMSNKEETS